MTTSASDELYHYLEIRDAVDPISCCSQRIVRTLALAAREREQRVGAFLFRDIQAKGTVEDFTPQESFLTMCRTLDLPCFNLVSPLRESWAVSGRELYYDHCHLTPDGNAVVSEALAKWLVEEGLLNR